MKRRFLKKSIYGLLLALLLTLLGGCAASGGEEAPENTPGSGGIGKPLPEYKLVGSQEADPMNRAVSEDSPFGHALMGAKKGDEIVVEAPVGELRYKVVKIER